MKRRVPTALLDLVFLPPPAGRWGRVMVLGMVFLGALGAFSWLWSPLGAWPPIAGAVVATLLHAAATTRVDRPLPRWGIRAARVAFAAVFSGWLLVAAAFGRALAWTVPVWGLAVLALLATAAIAGRFVRPPVRVPATLPVGLWILACVVGWGFEDGRTRCDDYLRVVSDPTVEIVLPAHSALKACQRGRSFRLDRYMRRIWEDPTGDRLVFTTQPGIFHDVPFDAPLPAELSGSICEFRKDAAGVRCVGEGKAEGIVESGPGDRLFVATWGGVPGKRGAVYAFPMRGPLEPLAVTLLEGPAVHLFHDAPTDTLGVLFDNASGMLPLRASDLAQVSDLVSAPFGPGDVFYEQESGEGLICFSPSLLLPFEGSGGALVAFQGRPFAPRLLASTRSHPWLWLALTWGCRFDAQTRTAWAVIANLGLLLRIDYDTGLIEDRFWVGPGMRSLVVDPERDRLYLAAFLSGEIVALDRRTGVETGRVFAGRFIRGLHLSRDEQSLWVASNLGLLRIPLGR